MYNVQDSSALVAGHRALLRPRAAGLRVPRTVVLLGLTSLLTDISSEAVAAVLPLYLVYAAGFSPLALGLIDGLYRGAAAITALASGFWADRRKRHKEVATFGYGLSAITKLGLVAAAGATAPIAVFVMLDRIGKGIRTAPRDALISLSASPKTLGTAFGVHRAMDTTGAMIGPLMAFGILALAPLAFTSVFLVSFCVAIAGLGVIALLVPSRVQRTDAKPPLSLRQLSPLLLERRFRALVLVASLLGLATISDAFLYLALQRKLDLAPAVFPLLFVGVSLAFMLLAVPGRQARRPRRPRPRLRRRLRAAAPGLRRRCSRRSWGTSGSDSCSRSSAPPTRRPTACSPRWPRGRSTRRRAGAGSPCSRRRRTCRASWPRSGSARCGRGRA